MMDSKCITSIINFIKQTDFERSYLHNVEIRPFEYIVNEEKKVTLQQQIRVFDSFRREAQLSNAWVASNLLLFSVFDGYLENKYSLKEGASFKNHFDNIPVSSCLDKMTKSCYRILKIIRNAIQHNLSKVVFIKEGYYIDYTNRNIHYKLIISDEGIRCLYTIVFYIIQNRIDGLGKEWSTKGHYEGILFNLYNSLLENIYELSDEIGRNNLYIISDIVCIKRAVRYPVVNPIVIVDSDDFVVFAHIQNNFTDDQGSSNCAVDYKYREFLLPQEIGTITNGKGKTISERNRNATIRFRKRDCIERWKVDL